MSEIKPIAWTSETQLSAVVNSGDGIMAKDSGRWKIALYDQSAIDHLTAERDAAVADAERYRKLRKLTPYRFKKIQDEAIIDAVDVKYFHADIFDAELDAVIEEQEQGK